MSPLYLPCISTVSPLHLPYIPFVMGQAVTLREDHMRPINPTPYKVSVSSELYEKLHTIWLAESPIPDID